MLAVYKAAARGLIAAHQKKLVHRDFKPDNVMVGADGRVRVMDFGLASVSSERIEPESVDEFEASERSAFDPLTRTGSILGTPAYMSPEQLRAEPADVASDQFSFCVAFYEGLYGERPFGGKTLGDQSASPFVSSGAAAGTVLPASRGQVTAAGATRVIGTALLVFVRPRVSPDFFTTSPLPDTRPQNAQNQAERGRIAQRGPR